MSVWTDNILAMPIFLYSFIYISAKLMYINMQMCGHKLLIVNVRKKMTFVEKPVEPAVIES